MTTQKKTARTVKNSATPKTAKSTQAVKAYGLGGGFPYPGKSHELRRAFTMAALKVAGLVNIAPKSGLCSRPKSKGDYALFAAITNGKAARVWSKALIESGEYIAKAQGAMKGEAASGYNATVDTVDQFIALIKKGGKATVKDSNGKAELVALDKPIKG